MIESFVDLTYRGLALGKRVKLTQVRPSTGYLETPAPMPVGTAISIATDDGITLEAMVMAIHEQVGGSDRVPGMVVAPALADAARTDWWKARVALPEELPASTRLKSVTVRPRSQTIVEAQPPAAAAAQPAEDPTVVMPVISDDDPGATRVMNPIDQETLRKSDELTAMRTTGEHEVIDDGKKTMMMDAVDPAALGLDGGASGSMAAGSEDEDDPDDPASSSPALPGSVKKRKKKR